MAKWGNKVGGTGTGFTWEFSDTLDIIPKSMKKMGEEIVSKLYNNLLKYSAAFSFIIKDRMRKDSGIMAASFGIYDMEYIQPLESMSDMAKERINNNIQNAYSKAKSFHIWQGQSPKQGMNNTYISIGSDVPWLETNEYELGDINGLTYYIYSDSQLLSKKMQGSMNNMVKRIVDRFELKGKFNPEQIMDLNDEKLMKKIGLELKNKLSLPYDLE
jgi:hypothetical protein